MLAWRDDMSSGHHGIDNANKQLIARIVQFEKALATSGTRTAIGLFLTGLYEQTAIAFSHEEHVQRECAFPFLEAHARAHAAMLKSLSDLTDRYAEMDVRTDPGPLLHDLAGLIKPWITEHIPKDDSRLKLHWLRTHGVFLKG